MRLLRITSAWVLNVAKDGDSAVSVSNLFHCLTTLTINLFLLRPNWSYPYCSMCVLSLILCCEPPRRSWFLWSLKTTDFFQVLSNTLSVRNIYYFCQTHKTQSFSSQSCRPYSIACWSNQLNYFFFFLMWAKWKFFASLAFWNRWGVWNVSFLSPTWSCIVFSSRCLPHYVQWMDAGGLGGKSVSSIWTSES